MSVSLSTTKKQHQTGAMMVEVMVALFVLAIGLMAALAMQVNGQQSNQRATMITEAYILANEMAELILATDNPDIASDDDLYNGIDTKGSGFPTNPPGCISTGCNKSNQIAYNAWNWGDSLSRRLPGGRGKINFDAGSSIYQITVMWDQDRSGATGDGCSGDTSVDLTCYVIEVML